MLSRTQISHDQAEVKNYKCYIVVDATKHISNLKRVAEMLIFIFYHLIISYRLNVRSNVIILFFFRPTNPPLREGGPWETKRFIGMA